MFSESRERAPYEVIEQKKKSYVKDLPEPDPDWPTDVQIVYAKIHDRLFERSLVVQEVLNNCGIYNNDIYVRFRYFVGLSIYQYVIYHRICLSKRLLQYNYLLVSQIALSIGYDSPSGFSKTFREHVGGSPTEFRERKRKRK